MQPQLGITRTVSPLCKQYWPSIYDVLKKSCFWPTSPCLHEPDPPSHPCGRPHAVDNSTWNTHRSLKTASRLQWSSRPKAEIRLYDCNLFKTVLLVIYITNLYCWKISTFYSVQRQNSGKKDANFFAWEEDRMTSVDSSFNFLCWRPHGAWPPSPCPHASTWAWHPSPSVWTS